MNFGFAVKDFHPLFQLLNALGDRFEDLMDIFSFLGLSISSLIVRTSTLHFWIEKEALKANFFLHGPREHSLEG